MLESLEQRQLLASITPIEVAGGYELELAYDVGETADDLPDVRLRTDSQGDLQYYDSEASSPGYIDLGVNLWNGSVDSQTITVTFQAQSDGDYTEWANNLFNAQVATLRLETIRAPGVDLTFEALAIDVEETVSTRDIGSTQSAANAASQGDSGSITLNSAVVDVTGSLYAHVLDRDTTNEAGDVTISAIGNLDDIASGFIVAPGPVPDISVTRARVDVSGSIRGRDVSIDVESDASDLFNDEDEPGAVNEAVLEYLGSVSLLAGVAISKSVATIDIDGGEILGRNVGLSTTSASDAEARVLSTYLAVAFGHSEPTATVDVRNNASVRATEDLNISTFADSDLSVEATQNLIGTSTTVEKFNVTINTAYSNVTSAARLSSDSELSAGDDLNVDVDAKREHLTGSLAAAYGDGTLATAINVAVHDTTLEALLDGTVTTGRDLIVEAEMDTPKNDFNATSTVGTGQLGGWLQSTGAGQALTFTTGWINSLASSTSSAVTFDNIRDPNNPNAARQDPNKFGLAASINVGVTHNDVTVRIGEGALVQVGGDMMLRGHAEELPETSAISFLSSSNLYLTESNGSYSQRETGIAGAITVGYFDNEVDVYIGNNADVTVGGDLTIASEATIPYDPQYIWNFKLGEDAAFEDPERPGTYTDKLNYNLGIQNGLFSSWAEAVASAQERAVGVMVNVLLGNTHNYAYIGDGANVTVGGDLQILADTSNDTINFVGSPLIPFNATEGQGIGAAFMATGYVNDTTARVNPLAEINADSVLVLSNNRGRNISIGIQGGLSDSYNGFNGAFTSGFVDNRTIAKISPSANIELGDGMVAVPIAMETLRQDENSFSTSVPQFNPTEGHSEEDETLTRVDPDLDTITLPYRPGLTTGDALIYDNRGGDSIGGLQTGQTYYAIVGDDSDFVIQLARTYDEAIAGTEVDLDLDDLAGSTNQNHSLYPGFDPTASGAVDVAARTVNVGREHRLVSGQPVLYSVGDGVAPIGGLQDGETYYVAVDSNFAFGLASDSSTAVDANLTKDFSNLLPITSGAAGRGHSFTPINYTSVDSPNMLRVLDSNDDGEVDADDDYVTGINSIAATNGSPSIQTDTNLLVLAEDQTFLYAGTGAVTKTLSNAAGVAVNVNVINRQTDAFIGSEERVLGDAEFTPGLGIDSSGLITLDYDHGFSVGDTVTYTAGGDEPVAGLVDRGVYTVTSVPSSNSFRLGRTEAEATTTFTATDVSGAAKGWTIDLGYDHGFQSGDIVQFTLGDGDDPIDGLIDGRNYAVIATGAQTISLAESVSEVAYQYQHQFTPATSIDDNLILLGYEHSLEEGDLVIYKSGGGSPVGGLEDGETYRVLLDDEEPLGLRLERTGLSTGAITLDPSAATGLAHTLHPAFFQSDIVKSNDPGTNNTISLGYAHGLETGDPVQFAASSVAGLTEGTRYYVIVEDDRTFALATSEDDANQGRTQYFSTSGLLDNGDATEDANFDTIDLYRDHGFQDGDQVAYVQNGSPYIGLIDGEVYTVRRLDTSPNGLELLVTKLQLLDSDGNLVELTSPATSGNEFAQLINVSSRVDLTFANDSTTPLYLHRDGRIALDASAANGTGYAVRLNLDSSNVLKDTHGFAPSFDPATALSDDDGNGVLDTIDLGYKHNYSAGQEVLYTASEGRSIVGLAEGRVYFVRLVNGSSTKIQLAESLEAALSTVADPEIVEYDTEMTTGQGHAIASVLRAQPTVDGPTNTVNFGRLHGFAEGDQVVYTHADGESPIDGLVSGTTYTVLLTDDPRLIQLSSDGTNPIELDPTSATGLEHVFSDAVFSDAEITSEGTVGVASANVGEIIAVTVAGSIATPNKTNKFTGAGWSYSSAKNDAASQYFGGTSVSGTFAINVQVDRTFAYIENATITSTGGGLFVEAFNDTGIYMGAGAVTYTSVDNQFGGGSGKAIAGAFAINVVASHTKALVDNSELTLAGDLQVQSDSDGTLVAIALAGAGSKSSLAAAGALVVNVVSFRTIAEVRDSTVTTTGDFGVKASNTTQSIAAAGGIAFADDAPNAKASQTSSVGFGLAFNIVSNALRESGTIALVQNSTLDVAGDLDVEAMTDALAFTISAAAGLSLVNTGNTLGLALSLGVNVISTRTVAAVRGNRDDNPHQIGGDASVSASDDSVNVGATIGLSLANAQNGRSTAVGAGLVFTILSTEITAEVDDATLTANSLDVKASSNGTNIAGSVGLSGAEDLAVAGQLAFNYTEQDVTATISNSDITTTGNGGDVAVEADNASSVYSVSGAGAIAFGGSGGSGTGVGAAMSFTITNDTTKASIEDSTVVAEDGDVVVKGTSAAEFFSVTAGIAAGKQIGVAGSLATMVLTNETYAFVDNSTVDADRNMLVLADQDGDIETYAGAVGIGKNSVGAGASLAITVVDNTTKGYISGSTVNVRANDSDTITIPVWSDNGEESTEDISGLAVIASNSEEMILIAGTVGYGKVGALAVNLTPTSLTDLTYSYIQDSDINSTDDPGGDVIVRANQQADFLTFSGAAAVGGSFGSLGIGGAGLWVANETKAWVSDTDTDDTTGNGRQQINAGGNFIVGANSSLLLDSIVIGAALARPGSSAAGAGSVDFLRMGSTTTATVSDVDVNAGGDITVESIDHLDLVRFTGSAAFGQASAGATMILIINNNVTEARMVDAHTNSPGETKVRALSNIGRATTIAVSGAVGEKGAFNGVFTFYISSTTTRAVIEGDNRQANVNQDAGFAADGQSVTVFARDHINSVMTEGGAAIGVAVAGIGGNLLWLDMQNTVDAHIGNFSKVAAQSDVSVKAESDKDLTGLAAGLSYGTAGGFAGTLIVANIGSGVASGSIDADVGTDVIDAIKNGIGEVNDLTGASDGKRPDAVNERIVNQDTSFARPGDTNRSVQDVGAFIGEFAEITVGGDLTVEATETITMLVRGGLVSVGGGGAFGGSATFLNVSTVTEAFVDRSTTLAVDGAVTVDASANEDIEVTVAAGSGSIGFSAGVQYASLVVDSSQLASLGDAVEIPAARAVLVNAHHDRNVEAIVSTAALAAGSAIGFSGSKVALLGDVEADVFGSELGTLGSNGEVATTVGSLDVTASSTVSKGRAKSPALAGGLLGFAVAGTLADAIVSPNVRARLGTNTEVYADGAVNVTATTDQNADAEAVGVNGSLGVTVGLSGATAEISPEVETVISNGTSIIAGSVNIRAMHNLLENDGVTESSGDAFAKATSSG
ncbi:MAG: hypothetical protein AAFX06_26630, partial [Planctomycetota bacterium]